MAQFSRCPLNVMNCPMLPWKFAVTAGGLSTLSKTALVAWLMLDWITVLNGCPSVPVKLQNVFRGPSKLVSRTNGALVAVEGSVIHPDTFSTTSRKPLGGAVNDENTNC
jgi:hypothetical protein